MPLLKKDGQSVFYIHVPRTSGVFITRCFEKSGYEIRDHNKVLSVIHEKHKTQHYYRDLYMKWLDFSTIDYCFMSVRNPYTKMLSEVLYQQNQNSSSGTHTRSIGYRHTGCHFSVNKDSICEFIKYLIGFRMRTSDNHIRPQVEFYSEYVDYIVKQENCSKDLKNMNIDDLIVDTEFKFAEDVRSYYQNKLFNKNYDFFLNEESKELIYDAYREDFEKFGYEKDF